MGFLQKIIGGSVVTAAEGVANAIDRFVETPEEKQAAAIITEKLRQRPSELQVELNKIEAGHRTVFVAGWRPFIGWVAGTSLGLYFIPQYLLASYLWLTMSLDKGELAAYPISNAGLLELVFVLLGMGTLRGLDKWAGKAK